MLEYIIVTIFTGFNYLFVITPLIPMIRLKLLFGKDCKFSHSVTCKWKQQLCLQKKKIEFTYHFQVVRQNRLIYDNDGIQNYIIILCDVVINENVKPPWTVKFVYQLTLGNAVILNLKRQQILIILQIMVIQLILILLGLIFYFLVIKPLVPMIKLKLQFGSACRLYYGLFIGEIFRLYTSLKNSNDVMDSIKKDQKNKNVKFIAENYVSTVQIQVLDPEYYKHILLNHENYSKINALNSDQLLTQGLVFQSGEKWKQQRNLFTQHFEFDKLKSRVPLVNEITNQRLNEYKQDDQVFAKVLQITGDIVSKSFFGQDADKLQMNGKNFGTELTDLFQTLSGMRYKKYYLLKRIFFGLNAWKIFPTKEEQELQNRINAIRLQIEKLIQKRIVQHELKIDENENEVKNFKDDFLDIYIGAYLQSKKDKKNTITIEEIMQQFITLLNAGSDTTASFCYFCLFYLAQYPEIQSEIRQEIIQNCPGDTIEQIQLPNLVKLQAFFNEVFRLKNPAARPFVRKVENTHYVNDLKLEKGWIVTVDYAITNVQEKFYQNPLDFNYKRWLEPNPINENNGFVFIPFSAGPRNCIGQHMALIVAKIIIGTILKKFEVKPNKNAEIKWVFKLTYQLTPDNAVILQQIQ